jgi:dihydrofolate reductase
MGRVVWHTTMSLDGFIAGPNHAMDWVFRYDDGSAPEVDEQIRATGAVLAGRNTYNVGQQPDQHPDTAEVYAGAWQGPEFVLTHRPPEHGRRRTTFLSCDIRTAVATALAAAGGRDLLVLGANVAQQCVDAGLVTDLMVHIAPVLLGDGVRLFGRPGPMVELAPVSVSRAGQVTILRFLVPAATG